MKKKESGSTSPDRAHDEKKTKSSGCMLASNTVPCYIFESYPGDYHPITFLSFLRPLSVWQREGGRSDAITVGGGQRLRRMQSAQEQETKVRRDGHKGSVDPFSGFHPLYPLLRWETNACGAWCPHPHAIHPDVDRRAQGPSLS
jgi:hypothetical protein